MSINGKSDELQREDIIALAEVAGIKQTQAHELVDGVVDSIRRWPEFADAAGVEDERTVAIRGTLITEL
jgi:serine/threonine-protein kinase HipA